MCDAIAQKIEKKISAFFLNLRSINFRLHKMKKAIC